MQQQRQLLTSLNGHSARLDTLVCRRKKSSRKQPRE